MSSPDDALAAAIWNDQVRHIHETPARKADFGEPSLPFHPLLAEQLKTVGIRRLYRHQAEAFDACVGGQDVVVVTGTSSGKSLCYSLPAVEFALSEPMARCLFLFPTKSLAQDQLGKLRKLAPEPHIQVATFDGDTPKTQRSTIRKLSHFVLTNPDMLHLGILPNHDHWAKFLKALRLIVIDEMHVYRGVFGSNVANVLRRLLRLCEWHRAQPRIIACSATLANSTDVFQGLTGRTAHLIDQDGSPTGRKTYVFLNPPMVDADRRLSANIATSEVLASLLASGSKALAFSRSRVVAELVLRYTRKCLEQNEKPAALVESYRAGYTPKQRREIEQSLFKGKLGGLSSTSAMELGVDVGGLDAVVMNGYPGSVSSFWQQAGRAGRGGMDGLALFVAHDDPLEQFLVRDPKLLLEGNPEPATLAQGNPLILSKHLLCAAHERPLAPSELEAFGPNAFAIAEGLDRSGELAFRGGLFFYPSVEPPAPRVNIRGTGGTEVQLLLHGEVLGTMERWRALSNAHEGAVYLHQGAGYLVEKLDLDRNVAELVAKEVPYFTRSVSQTVVETSVEVRTEPVVRARARLVGVSVTDSVIAFMRKSLDGEHVLSMEPLDLPPQSYETLAFRLDLPAVDPEEMDESFVGGIHGLEHALGAVAPLFAGCERGDLGTCWYAFAPDTLAPAIYVFDRAPGGVGLCERLFEDRRAWFRAAWRLLSTCPCGEGCPACLLQPRCETFNQQLSKPQALRLLEMLAE